MIRFFKTLHPTKLFFIPLITLLLWMPAFFKGNFLVTERAGVIDGLILSCIGWLPKFFQLLLAVLLISVEAIYLNLIANKHEVLYKNTYLPALIYVVLMSFNKDVINFHQLLIVNLLVIFACDKLFALFKNDNPVSFIFDCGVLLSLASLVYFPCIFLLVYLLIVLPIIRPLSIKEWMIAFIAFGLPYYFLFAYGYVTDNLDSITGHLSDYWSIGLEKWTGSNHSIFPSFHNPVLLSSILPFALFFLFLLVLALYRLRVNYYKNSIKTRSVQQALIILILFLLAEILLAKKIELYHFIPLAIPFSVVLGYFYVTPKRRLWIYEASFWVLIGLIVNSYFS